MRNKGLAGNFSLNKHKNNHSRALAVQQDIPMATAKHTD